MVGQWAERKSGQQALKESRRCGEDQHGDEHEGDDADLMGVNGVLLVS